MKLLDEYKTIECSDCAHPLKRHELYTGICDECQYQRRISTQPLHIGMMGSQVMHEQMLSQDQV